VSSAKFYRVGPSSLLYVSVTADSMVKVPDWSGSSGYSGRSRYFHTNARKVLGSCFWTRMKGCVVYRAVSGEAKNLYNIHI
jgi:hypothetical protein